MSGHTPRPGRVAPDKVFEPTVRKRRLRRAGRETTADSELTAEAGAWLKSLREQKGISQAEMIKILGLKYRSDVSLIESGKSYLPPRLLRTYADAVGLDARHFVKQLLFYYAPVFYEIVLKDE